MLSNDQLHLFIGLGIGLSLGGVVATIVCSIIYTRSLNKLRAAIDSLAASQS